MRRDVNADALAAIYCMVNPWGAIAIIAVHTTRRHIAWVRSISLFRRCGLYEEAQAEEARRQVELQEMASRTPVEWAIAKYIRWRINPLGTTAPSRQTTSAP